MAAANDEHQTDRSQNSANSLQQRPRARPLYVVDRRSCLPLAWAGLRRGVRLRSLSAGPAVGAAGGAQAGLPGDGRTWRPAARADRVLLPAGLPAVALPGDAPDRPVDGGPCRAEAGRVRKRSPAIPSSRSARRSAARSPPWATATSAPSRAPPSLRLWSPTRSRRWSAPTTTTKSASAACSKRCASVRDTWSARPSRSAPPSPGRASRPVPRHLPTVSDQCSSPGRVQRQRRIGSPEVARREGRAHHHVARSPRSAIP